jgi:hypothetical protein
MVDGLTSNIAAALGILPWHCNMAASIALFSTCHNGLITLSTLLTSSCPYSSLEEVYSFLVRGELEIFLSVIDFCDRG